MKNFATEGAEVLFFAFGIRALDPRQTSGVVAALEERLDRLADTLESEAPQTLGKLLETCGKLREVKVFRVWPTRSPTPLSTVTSALTALARRFQSNDLVLKKCLSFSMSASPRLA